MAVKRKSPTIPAKHAEEVNKKAILWVGGVLLLFVIIVSTLLIVNG
ncbi:hypothetical protein M5X00_17165 [Paenibacillus alvei]|uniref:Uncharacterized protein n=1 Tax=Paenibacillus alvei TaxID=44250 RepID=A0AAP7A3A6_PAEAL|nr:MULTISPECIES: hypothetical protein [Paenibacillus]EJW17696.1 hypothetical protein PAV_3c01410 [Paenibacillus alvei DSM 29]MCY7486761.1 hypothetical protein [Paenibacillus alvei]MCY9540665.1 hypothetical protein [Paenibacillus alvei]MCY9577808.1 hypothetical protein [Paenibacillus alvei]MCY9586933.1 hypothetical protein [Paenibacillus alvei]